MIVDQRLLTLLRASITEAVAGDILTVNTVTGTGERTAIGGSAMKVGSLYPSGANLKTPASSAPISGGGI